MTSTQTLANEPWLSAAATRRVMLALGDARFVGGCVRNSLLGEPVDDIDIATPHSPDEVIRLVEAAGLRAVPTGIEHGTITVIANSKPFEVTTLRRDVTTDGRRAVVAFTREWVEDAARRDFTMNALYADAAGNLHDLVHGLADLRARRVRFIGDPSHRIAEDYLRILRLFRIHAWYGRGALDADGIRACVEARQKLSTLSGERIQKEMIKLMAARDPMPVLEPMSETGILAELVSGDVRLQRVQALCEVDRESGFKPDGVLRLGGLFSSLAQAKAVSERWRLSNEQRDRLSQMLSGGAAIRFDISEQEFKCRLYRTGSEATLDQVRLAWADDNRPGRRSNWKKLVAQAEAWKRPQFPLNGADVMSAGVPQGPQVGRIMAQVEAWWIDNGFKDARLQVLDEMHRIIAALK